MRIDRQCGDRHEDMQSVGVAGGGLGWHKD